MKPSADFLIIVECAIEHDGAFIFIKKPLGGQAGGLWSLPGGGVEHADGNKHCFVFETAIKREIFEELGIVLSEPIHYVTTSYFVDNRGKHVLDSIFHCKLKGERPQIVLQKKEIDEYCWMTPEELENNELVPSWLKHYISLIKD